MGDTRSTGTRQVSLGLGSFGVAVGAAIVSGAASQFVAYRVGYHPALGAPVLGHLYAPWKWIEWQQAPWSIGARRTFQIVDAGMFTAATAALFGGLAYSSSSRRRPKKHEGVHGTARFQSETEVRKSGLLPRKPGQPHAGAYVGGWTDQKGRTHYLRHDGPEHLIVIAPTRSGKGVCNVNTTLLSWPASVAVYDEKGELWELTAGWRAKHAGNIAIRLEFGAVEGSAGFNFLEEVRLGTPHEVADAQNIAQMLCDPNGKGLEDHWQKTSFALLTGLILHVLYARKTRGETASLSDVARALSDPARPADQLWQAMVDNLHLKTGPHPTVAAAGRDMMDREARERGSVLSSAKTYLTLFGDPLIAQNTQRSDFRIMDLMDHERPVSLYVITRGSDKERLRPLVRLLFTMMARTLMGVPVTFQNGQPVMPHKHRLLMMLDEFPSLGRMHVIEDALPKCAGYGIKCFPRRPGSRAALRRLWPAPDDHRQLPRPHHLRPERAGDREVGVRHDWHDNHREGGRDRERQPAGIAQPGEPNLSRGQSAPDDSRRDRHSAETTEGAGRKRQGSHHRGRRDGGVRRGREPD